MDSSINLRTGALRRLRRSRFALGIAVALAAVLAAVGVALVVVRGGGETASADTGWRVLPPAPIAPDFVRTGVWTGRELLVFGREQHTATDERGAGYATGSSNVAAAYDPSQKTWRNLSPPAGNPGAVGRFAAVWTGSQLLVWGPAAKNGGGLGYDPHTNVWRALPPAPADELAAGPRDEAAAGRRGLVAWLSLIHI